MLKPYKFAHSVPLYIYFIQIYWIFDPTLKIDDPLLHLYAGGFTILAFIFLIFVSILFYSLRRMREIKLKRLTLIIRDFFTFLYKDAEENQLIDPVKRDDFRRMRLELTDKAIENE
ncbi:hypothetical protein GCM10022258_42850 [Aquimarina gracilis]